MNVTAERVVQRYLARLKRAYAGSLEDIVNEFLAKLATQVGHALAKATKAHVSDVREHGGEMVVEVMARSGDHLHHFKVQVSRDEHLNVIGLLDYAMMTAHGQKERSKSVAFDLPSSASPNHFVDQIVKAALEQYQGVASTSKVEVLAKSV